ncbi:MAG: PIN domain-containing protein [Pirellulales bacterium]|nr:PIN domain-containing protein [Pirellulales bacterium]
MRYLLDTNVLIALTKGLGRVAERLEKLDAASVLIPAVVVAEIEYGIAKSRKRSVNRRVFDELLSSFAVSVFDAAAAAAYGPIRASLERKGRLIGPNDLLIAATAVALKATLVTDNLREFQRVDGLRVENWLA